MFRDNIGMRKTRKVCTFRYLDNFNKEQAGAELCQAQFKLRLAEQEGSFTATESPGFLLNQLVSPAC